MFSAHVATATTKANQIHSKQSKRVDSEKFQLEKVIPYLEGVHDLLSSPLPNGTKKANFKKITGLILELT